LTNVIGLGVQRRPGIILQTWLW